jgi:heat shock protein HslJ
MKNYIFTITIASFILISCTSSDTQKSQVNLLHDIWALDSLYGEKVIIEENTRNLPVLELYVKDERVHGNTGCNTIDGKLDIDNNKIKFLNLVTTEMACSNNIEQEFLSALKKVNNYKLEKMRLFLFEDDKELLVFKKID